MTLDRIAELKALAVAPDVQPWTLRNAVAALATELELLTRAYAHQREQLCAARRAIGDLKIVMEDPHLASLYGEPQV